MSVRRKLFLYFVRMLYIDINEHLVMGKYSSSSSKIVSVSTAVEENHKSVALVLMVHNLRSTISLSIINKIKHSTYQDNKEGKLYDMYTYYLIEVLERDSMYEIEKKLNQKKEAFDKFFKIFSINYKNIITIK